MIKQLQLRGISRNPSDRMTSDGGCAESLNVFLDNNETAPALKPTVVNDMTDERGIAMFPFPDWGHSWEAVFIHKTPIYQRAIIKYTDIVYVAGVGTEQVKLGVWNGSGCTPFVTLDSGEEFIRCINLGNSLGVVTSNGTSWVLMKGGQYLYLGSAIPFPAFTFANYDVAASDTAGEEVIRTKEDIYRVGDFNAEAPSKAGLSNNSRTWILEEIDKILASNARQGIFNRQMFAVLAIRLYDGTRIASTPVLIAPGFENPFEISGYIWDHDQRNLESFDLTLNMAYKLFFRLDENANFFSRWEEIIDSFEIYLSPQIDVDRSSSYFLDDYEATKSGDTIVTVTGTPVLGKENSTLQRYLDSSNFYKVYSAVYSEETVQELRDGIIVDAKSFMTTDSLVTGGIRLDTLSDMKHYDVKFTRATLYNNKIIASDITEKVQMHLNTPIAKGYWNPSLSDVPVPAHTYEYSNGEILAFRMTFHLRDSYGRLFKIKATNKGSEYFTFGNEVIDGTSLKSNGYGMIFCPDVRAFAADIVAYYGSPESVLAGMATPIGGATLSLSPHPNLDCSYWYGDITSELVGYCSQSATYIPGDASYEESKPNKVYVSEMDNPFVFPVASRYTLNSKVIGCAIATNALSEGQFGQFPIYVFTEEGIWVMESSSDGTIVSTKPMSREVCSNADSITSIDNAVVFMTEKAVMLVSGSQITDLSPFMNGKHYFMESGSREAVMIAAGDWREYVGTLMDTTHFMAFMSDASIAYDYKGSRLVFINPGETFQYVYMLKTNTWHKMFVDGYGAGPQLSSVLNVYPDTYVNARSGDRYVWDLSTELDVTSSTSIKGVIVTRPFDLDAPDVRKCIRDIRIRGYFNRRDVRYILLGSMDGIHWGVLPSLHGGSYKWFRLILLTSLSPTERISWIDIDFDTRQVNKLR